MTHQDIPQPEVRELPFDYGWARWDEAKQEQDAGFFKLQPVDQKPVNLSERSAYRAGVRV